MLCKDETKICCSFIRFSSYVALLAFNKVNGSINCVSRLPRTISSLFILESSEIGQVRLL